MNRKVSEGRIRSSYHWMIFGFARGIFDPIGAPRHFESYRVMVGWSVPAWSSGRTLDGSHDAVGEHGGDERREIRRRRRDRRDQHRCEHPVYLEGHVKRLVAVLFALYGDEGLMKPAMH